VSRAAVLLLALSLAGCASVGGGREREDLPPPPDPDRYQADVSIRKAWSRPLGRLPAGIGFALRPAIAAGRVLVADADGRVHAYAAESGELLWQRHLERPISGGPGAAGRLVVVGTRDGEAIGLRATDGEVLWRSGLTSEILAQPAVAPELVVVRVADGRVFGLEAATGQRRWLYEQSVPSLTLRGTGSPLLVPERLVVAGLDTGELVALAPDDGRLLWETTVAVPRGRSDLERMVDIDADPVLYRTAVYAASFNGRLAAVDAASGRIRWDRELSVFAGIAVDSERVYASDADRRVWAFDRFSGASVWRQDALRGLQLTAPAVFGDYVVVGDDAGYLNWLAVRDGSLQRRERIGGAFVAPPLVQGDTVYLLTEDGLTVLRRRS
jgi:outer membrane protein assembly factor BamB